MLWEQDVYKRQPFTVNDRSTELELLYIDDLVEGMFDLLEGKEQHLSLIHIYSLTLRLNGCRADFLNRNTRVCCMDGIMDGTDILPLATFYPCERHRLLFAIGVAGYGKTNGSCSHEPVSYTHLDVYKRQGRHRPAADPRPGQGTERWGRLCPQGL